MIGIAAIVVASALERSRDRIRQVAHRLDEMTEGWERFPVRGGDQDDETSLPPPTVDLAPSEEPSDEPQPVS